MSVVDGVFLDGYIEGELFDYQVDSVLFALSNKRCVIGDPVGSGKTVESVALISYLKSIHPEWKTLVVTKKRAFTEWKNTLLNFTSHLSFQFPKKKNFKFTDVDIVNWESTFLRKGKKSRAISTLIPLDYDIIIFDEITKVKNHTTKLHKVALKLSAFSKYVIGLSATVIENKVSEAYNIFKVIDKNVFPFTRKDFQMQYLQGYTISIFNPHTGDYFDHFVETGLKPYMKNDFMQMLQSRYIRHDVDVVNRINLTKSVSIIEGQSKLYNEIIGEEYEGFAKLIYLEQVCAGFNPFDGEFVGSKKYDLIDKLSAVVDGGLVVFSRFLAPIYYLKEHYGFSVITGENQSNEEVEQIKKDFNSEKIKKLAITTAGEYGMDLYAGQVIVFVSYVWNPARMDQIAGRVCRKSNIYKDVYIIRLVTEQTAEEKIIRNYIDRKIPLHKLYRKGKFPKDLIFQKIE